MPSHLMLRFLEPDEIGGWSTSTFDVVHELPPVVGRNDFLLGWVLRPLADERNVLIGGFDPDVNVAAQYAAAQRSA